MIARIDLWVGKTLFVPLIIRICQLLGWSQHRFYNMTVAIFWLLIIYDWLPGTGWLKRTVDVLFCTCMMIRAAVKPDAPTKKTAMCNGIRRFVLLMFFLNLVITIARSPDFTGMAFTITGLVLLFALYAQTIDTIPPREIREPARKRQTA